VLVNDAGQGLHVPLAEVRFEDLRAVTELNVCAPLVAVQAVLPAMRAQGGGAIINVSSGTSRMVLPGVGAYAATKAALNLLSKVAHEEFAPDGVVVSLVYPSVTATEFHHALGAGAFAVPRPAPPGRWAPRKSPRRSSAWSARARRRRSCPTPGRVATPAAPPAWPGPSG
jgi:short-subunit dehydrogenase